MVLGKYRKALQSALSRIGYEYGKRSKNIVPRHQSAPEECGLGAAVGSPLAKIYVCSECSSELEMK